MDDITILRLVAYAQIDVHIAQLPEVLTSPILQAQLRRLPAASLTLNRDGMGFTSVEVTAAYVAAAAFLAATRRFFFTPTVGSPRRLIHDQPAATRQPPVRVSVTN